MSNVETKTVVLPAGNGLTGKTIKPKTDEVKKGRNGRSCSTHLSNAIRDLEYAIEMEPVLEKIFESTLILITAERDSRRNVTVKSFDQLKLEKERMDKRFELALKAEQEKQAKLKK